MSGQTILDLAPGAVVVDLDGTLIYSDLLIETFVAFVGRQPLGLPKVLGWLARGKATLKHELAAATSIDVATLPYNTAVLEKIQEARAEGRKVYLASASDARLVEAVARHLNCFDGWFASDGKNNLSAAAKAAKLVAEFGEKGFCYIGNSADDLPVWAHAEKAIIANAAPSLIRQAEKLGVPCEALPRAAHGLRPYLKMVRPHQWAKNALVFVAVLTAHLFSLQAFGMALLAFIAYSLCASSVYIVNDMVDVTADRQHPTKKKRPFAAGTVPILTGLALAPLLIIAGFAVAALVSLKFMAVLAGYLVITTAYSFWLKRKLLVDTMALAILYTLRVIGGIVAVNVPATPWLLAFSMFLFLSLAFVKRYSEMALRADAGLPNPSNRNYQIKDLPVLGALAAASGFSAVIVFALYLSSPYMSHLYRHPAFLWLACPVLLYWVSRMLMMSHRRVIREDPVLFAIRDRMSLLSGLLIVIFIVLGI